MSITPSSFFRLPNELLLIVATNLNQRDLVFLSCTCKINFNLFKPALAGFKLFNALLDGDDDLARQLTKQPFINLSVLHKGLSLLHVAVAQGNLGITEWLISKSTRLLEVHDGTGQTALMFAVYWKEENISKFLIGKGACVNAQDDSGFTALHFAAEDGDTSMVSQLLEAGANVLLADSNGWTAVLLAVKENHVPVVIKLITQGANPRATNSSGENALYWAVRNGNMVMVRLLIDNGADPKAIDTDKDGNTILHWAVQQRSRDIIRFLVLVGADLKVENSEGETPLQLIIHYFGNNLANLLGEPFRNFYDVGAII
jgi:ankyrin repeat protein